MAEEKDKPSADERVRILLMEIFVLILFIFLITRLIAIYSVNNDIYAGFLAILQSHGLTSLYYHILWYVILIGILLSILFLIGIVYCAFKLHEVRKVWYAMLHPAPDAAPEKEAKNERWQKIQEHIGSGSPSDWRLAILECDIVLDELFDKLGYVGGTIGDKLKNIDPAHFKSLNNAWEAHKIRNAIAHEGQDFTLTDREAKRVVALYESVFREFDFI